MIGTVKATRAWPGWPRKTWPALTAPALSGVSFERAGIREWAPLVAEQENWIRSMATEIEPIRTEAAVAEVERVWGAKSGTPRGDRLDVLATLIKERQYPFVPPGPIEAIKLRMA